MTNHVRDVLAGGGTAFGFWCGVSSPAALEILAHAQPDYIVIDCQHGMIDEAAMRLLVMVLSRTDTTPIVRVPDNDASAIGRALDAGAQGIIVPVVDSADEAVRAARACRYPPAGERSFALMRAYQALGRDPEAINRDVLCLPMIETKRGLDAVEEICSAPGIDGVYIGPSDLALGLGLKPSADITEPAHRDAVDRIRRACIDNGIIPGIHSYSGAAARAHADNGFRIVTAGLDSVFLALGARAELGAARDGG